jgi:hypothetical protein
MRSEDGLAKENISRKIEKFEMNLGVVPVLIKAQ